ncbi:exopolysaccharide biosynthesis protein [Desulfosporosinus orientis DSM 765]|uniref:Exopolysaccharide biosynthesis protein n=1 Tax=Desulfosporosinus orientis (strain ATCC 19365 / DSM 765 / NCIMB 8382 / VKM B-1628 / Singapore I) TaxID=768706 RepID=G7W7H1_DESOD|nr:phosphodiester glycosidase family protein [Desulfosporosinus orientis]AET65890.1 exopolysaccharide biosynthesis protein [Desulfosporosinus orientis DSM 765]
MGKIRKISIKRIMVFFIFNLGFSVILTPLFVFWGPFEGTKTLAVGSILSSRHPQVVKAFLSDEKISEIVNKYDNAAPSDGPIRHTVSDASAGITIEDIKGKAFKGKVMLIKDPKRIKVAVTKELGVTGERVSDFVKDTGAIAGINGGGFYDPNGAGNGAYPDGLTVHNGEIVHNNIGSKSTEVVALDKDGKLIVGPITADDVKKKNIQEAVSFWPALIQDGKKGVFQDSFWGVAPRTAIGQKADDTIILVIIDGRQPTWSWGAKMSDLYNLFLDYGAVNAANLDGGSSTELFYKGKVINKLWNWAGERYLPTAFVVMPE